MENKISITIYELEALLNEQKKIVIENLVSASSYYNSTNTSGSVSSLPIDKEKFYSLGMKSRFPNEFNVLQKYLKS